MPLSLERNPSQIQEDCMKKYGTSTSSERTKDPCHRIQPNQVIANNYIRCIAQPISSSSEISDSDRSGGFESTIQFFDDLIAASNELKNADPKIIALRTILKKMNEHLPANVYVPFVKDKARFSCVLNIVVSESRVFSTKERAPFYICLELFSLEEENNAAEQVRSNSTDAPLITFADWRKEQNLSRAVTVYVNEGEIHSSSHLPLPLPPPRRTSLAYHLTLRHRSRRYQRTQLKMLLSMGTPYQLTSSNFKTISYVQRTSQARTWTSQPVHQRLQLHLTIYKASLSTIVWSPNLSPHVEYQQPTRTNPMTLPRCLI